MHPLLPSKTTTTSLGQVLRYGVFPKPSSPKNSVNPCTVSTRVEFGPFLWLEIKLISGRLSKANRSFVETDSFIFSFVRKWSPNSLRALTERWLVIIVVAKGSRFRSFFIEKATPCTLLAPTRNQLGLRPRHPLPPRSPSPHLKSCFKKLSLNGSRIGNYGY